MPGFSRFDRLRQAGRKKIEQKLIQVKCSTFVLYLETVHHYKHIHYAEKRYAIDVTSPKGHYHEGDTE